MSADHDYKHGGVKMKYLMFRADGTALSPEACYFTLRLDQDPHARVAALSYASSVRSENDDLADELEACVKELQINSSACTCGGRGDAYCPFHDGTFSTIWRYGEPTKPTYSELEQQLATVTDELEGLKASVFEYEADELGRYSVFDVLDEYKRRAEAAEARIAEADAAKSRAYDNGFEDGRRAAIAEAEKQGPALHVTCYMANDYELPEGAALYLAPIPSRDTTELIRKALELTDDLREILGRPNFTCAPLAVHLRDCGHTILPKAEHEQAAVIHWLLTLYIAHGSEWKKKAADAIRARSEKENGK